MFRTMKYHNEMTETEFHKTANQNNIRKIIGKNEKEKGDFACCFKMDKKIKALAEIKFMHSVKGLECFYAK